MIVTGLLLLSLALVALLAYRERVAARERAQAATDRIQLAALADEERRQAAEERRELYQRIQAPEIAVSEAVRRERGPYVRRKPIGADDDRAFLERGAGGEEADRG